MTNKNILTIFKNYQKKSTKKKMNYFRVFEEKMAYRTTKTENPSTTKKMVRQTLSQLQQV